MRGDLAMLPQNPDRPEPDRRAESLGKSVRRAALREQGIRTATALPHAYHQSATRKDTEEFEGIVAGGPPPPIRALADALETNPNLGLIRTWRGIG